MAAVGVAADRPPSAPVGGPRPAVQYDPQLYPLTEVTDSPVSEPGREPTGKLLEDAQSRADDQLREYYAAQQARKSSSRVAARAASRTRFAGLDHTGALSLARRTFPTLLSGPSAGALSSGQTASEYIDQYTAVVKDSAPDGGNSTVVSSTPLQAENARGDVAPVDVTLKQAGDGWSATNPLEDYRIGRQADEGVAFPGVDLTVRPVGRGTPGEVAGRTVFYAGTDTDTDTIVKPLTSGVQFAWQLRSAKAPGRLSLVVDLPEGARLASPGRDGVRVVKDGRTIARLGAPTAFDADGQVIPTRLETDGNRITVVIDHADKDLAYPIAVDPDFVAGFYFSFQGLDAFDYWGDYNSSGGRYTLLGGDFWYGRGLYVRSQGYPQEPTPVVFHGGGPGSGDHAGGYFSAPGNAHIWKAYSAVSRHILGASLMHCMIVGIAGPNTDAWEGPYGTTFGEGCTPFASYSWTVTTPGQGGTPGNAFVFGEYAYSNNQTAVDSFMGDVEIWMSDPDAPHGPPAFAGPQVMAPQIPPNWNSNAADPISAVAYDDSSGVASITFYGPASWTFNGMNGSSGITINNPGCGYGPCTKKFTAAVPIGNMPDGEQTVWAYARDASGQYSPASYPYTLNFDLVPPPTPQGATSAGFDPTASTATIAVEPGKDDADGIVRTQVSPLDDIRYRWKRPNGAFSAWSGLALDWSFVVTNAQLGEAIDVEAQSFDTAGHASGVLRTTVVIEPTPHPGDLDPIQAPPGPSSADIVIDVNADLDGVPAGAMSGGRVTIERISDGATYTDDADANGIARYEDREPGAYRIMRLGVPGTPDVDSPSSAQFTAVANAATSISIPLKIRTICNAAGSLPGLSAYCDLNTQERNFIFSHSPWYSVQFLLAARQSIQRTIGIFNGGNNVELNDTRANAFQHSLWVALMVRRAYNAPCRLLPPSCGDFPSFAWDYAEAHESDDLSSPIPSIRQSALMDRHNNYVGYAFADRREENRNSDKRLCDGMRSAVWGGSPRVSSHPLQLYWLNATDSNGVYITDPPHGSSVCG